MDEISTRDLIMGNLVARAFAVTGDAWTQLILREAFYGARRFSVWRDRLGMPRSVLTDRLNRLVAAGLLEQRAAPRSRPPGWSTASPRWGWTCSASR